MIVRNNAFAVKIVLIRGGGGGREEIEDFGYMLIVHCKILNSQQTFTPLMAK